MYRLLAVYTYINYILAVFFVLFLTQRSSALNLSLLKVYYESSGNNKLKPSERSAGIFTLNFFDSVFSGFFQVQTQDARKLFQ